MSLERPPRPSATSEVVDAVRRCWRRSGAWDCESQIKALGWSVEYRQLDAVRGGHQALLVPRPTGGFHVVVDPDPTPAQHACGVESHTVIRWRVAHEYAHTFFYAHRHVPRRPTPPSADEEAFCDDFANELLGTDLRSRPS